mgnify:CR=1 FL=1
MGVIHASPLSRPKSCDEDVGQLPSQRFPRASVHSMSFDFELGPLARTRCFRASPSRGPCSALQFSGSVAVAAFVRRYLRPKSGGRRRLLSAGVRISRRTRSRGQEGLEDFLRYPRKQGLSGQNRVARNSMSCLARRSMGERRSISRRTRAEPCADSLGGRRGA